jgi:trimethylamine--corrinoid protein Co-methyltransferase
MSRARDRARDILETHTPSYLTPEQEQDIRARFNILVS